MSYVGGPVVAGNFSYLGPNTMPQSAMPFEYQMHSLRNASAKHQRAMSHTQRQQPLPSQPQSRSPLLFLPQAQAEQHYWYKKVPLTELPVFNKEPEALSQNEPHSSHASQKPTQIKKEQRKKGKNSEKTSTKHAGHNPYDDYATRALYFETGVWGVMNNYIENLTIPKDDSPPPKRNSTSRGQFKKVQFSGRNK